MIVKMDRYQYSRNNFLDKISPQLFRNNIALEELDLSQNQILKLDKSAIFKKNKQLKVN